MLAAVYRSFGGPIEVETVPKPTCPDDGVLIQVRATGVCRSDFHGWQGHDTDIVQYGLPFVPGHEASGIVVESAVSEFQLGDRVAVPFILSCGTCNYCTRERRPTVCLNQKQPGFTQWGSFAEYLAIPRAATSLAIIPEAVSFQQAAALGCRFTTAYRAVVQQGRVSPESSVAIFGCGGLGLSCVMLAAAARCETIIVVDVNKGALQKALELGATHAVLQGESDKECRGKVLALSNGGVHVSIEASGFSSACENAVHCTRPAGRMIQVGLVTSVQPTFPMGLVAARELEVIGSHGFAAENLPELLALVESRKLDPSRIIEREVSLFQGAKALENMKRGSPLGITMITSFGRKSRL